MDKVTKKYALLAARNPQTGEALTRPIIAERQTRSMANVIEFAVQNNYMTGQVENLTGTVKGFFEALKQYCLQGQDVTLASWIRIHGELTGTVGETGTLDTTRNAYRVRVNALNELAVPLDTFSWSRADDSGVKVTIRAINAEGGTQTGIIVKSKAIEVTGSNLVYSAELGDAVELAWDEDGDAKSATLTPATSSVALMKFEWPTELATAAVGTVVMFKFKLHGGVKDAPVQVVTKRATLSAE